MVECAVVPDHRRLVRMGFVDAARRAAIDHRLGYLLEMKGVAADRQQVARAAPRRVAVIIHHPRSEEHTSELQSLMRISYAVFCLKTRKSKQNYSAPSPTMNKKYNTEQCKRHKDM